MCLVLSFSSLVLQEEMMVTIEMKSILMQEGHKGNGKKQED